jgi:hypothetical protein
MRHLLHFSLLGSYLMLLGLAIPAGLGRAFAQQTPPMRHHPALSCVVHPALPAPQAPLHGSNVHAYASAGQ